MKPAREDLGVGVGVLLLFTLGLLFCPQAACCQFHDKSNHRIDIGIDLGRTYSRVAYGRNRSDIHVVPGGDNETSIPSCVAFTEAGPLIGTATRLWGIENPKTTICNHQALLGRNWSDPDVQTFIKDFPYEVLSGYRDNPVFKIGEGGKGKVYAPEEVTNLIIGELKSMAEVAMGGNETVARAVITVPGYYTDQQKQGIRDAARLAGIEVFRALSEPKAASLAYGFNTAYDRERNIVVVDMGDSLDVSVWNVEEDYFDELATSHHDVGGELLSRGVINYLVEFWNRTGLNLVTSPAHIRKPNLEVGFEEIIENFVALIMEAIHQTLNEAKLNFTQIDDVILTGGSGSIPRVEEFPNRTVHEELGGEATVIGAARHAILLSELQDTMCRLYLPESSPLGFGIETADGTVATIIPRRSFLPFRGSMNFSTAIDGQSTMLVRILQGQRVRAADNLVVGELEFPLAPAPAGIPRIEVTLKATIEHAIYISATDLGEGSWLALRKGPDKVMWIGESYEYPDRKSADSDNWDVDNVVKYNVLGHPARVSELLRDIKSKREDLEFHRGTWDLETLQELKEVFTYRIDLGPLSGNSIMRLSVGLEGINSMRQ
ncbi:Hsp70 protein-domain-containing protein [Xylaria venustula]|nr:Hsp70 protein-domain-containing protein [Xylaria venustula]